GELPTEWMLLVTPVTSAAPPATTHVDGTARVHVVHETVNPPYHALLRAFGAATGTPVLLNTSFNLAAEPIVASPTQALATFLRSELDAVWIGCHRVTRPA
ncbi:MAG: carbamoyltransferase C-terminal domain-containing protein, partial [Myxococcota bacterium]